MLTNTHTYLLIFIINLTLKLIIRDIKLLIWSFLFKSLLYLLICKIEADLLKACNFCIK